MPVSFDVAAAVPALTAVDGAALAALLDVLTADAAAAGPGLATAGDFGTFMALAEEPEPPPPPEPTGAAAVPDDATPVSAAAVALALLAVPGQPDVVPDAGGEAPAESPRAAGLPPAHPVPASAPPPATLGLPAAAPAVPEATPPTAVAEHAAEALPAAEPARALPAADGGHAAPATAPPARAAASLDAGEPRPEGVADVGAAGPPSETAEAMRPRAGATGAAAPDGHRLVALRPDAAPPAEVVTAEQGGDSGEGRAPGRRGSDAGVVVKHAGPALARDESPPASRTTGGPDPSTPSALPSAPPREPPPAPAPAAAPEPARDVERLLRLHGLRAAPAPDRGEMRLEVATDLGRVEVRVAVRADAVHANLFAQHDQAREMLETHRGMLAAALERSNLRLEGFSVGLGHHQQGADGEPERPGGGLGWGGTVPHPPLGEVVVEPAVASRGLSLRA